MKNIKYWKKNGKIKLLKETELTNENGLLCAEKHFHAQEADCTKKNVAEAAYDNGQHYTPSASSAWKDILPTT